MYRRWLYPQILAGILVLLSRELTSGPCMIILLSLGMFIIRFACLLIRIDGYFIFSWLSPDSLWQKRLDHSRFNYRALICPCSCNSSKHEIRGLPIFPFWKYVIEFHKGVISSRIMRLFFLIQYFILIRFGSGGFLSLIHLSDTHFLFVTIVLTATLINSKNFSSKSAGRHSVSS